MLTREGERQASFEWHQRGIRHARPDDEREVYNQNTRAGEGNNSMNSPGDGSRRDFSPAARERACQARLSGRLVRSASPKRGGARRAVSVGWEQAEDKFFPRVEGTVHASRSQHVLGGVGSAHLAEEGAWDPENAAALERAASFNVAPLQKLMLKEGTVSPAGVGNCGGL
jgi:hypothetical protein